MEGIITTTIKVANAQTSTAQTGDWFLPMVLGFIALIALIVLIAKKRRIAASGLGVLLLALGCFGFAYASDSLFKCTDVIEVEDINSIPNGEITNTSGEAIGNISTIQLTSNEDLGDAVWTIKNNDAVLYEGKVNESKPVDLNFEKNETKKISYSVKNCNIDTLHGKDLVKINFTFKATKSDIKNFDADWIWCKNPTYTENDYAEFRTSFDCASTDGLKMDIACESIYALYINEKLSYFAQSSDFPVKAQYMNDNYKLYDDLDISKDCKVGNNEIRIVVWHNPGDSGAQSFLSGPAGVIFQVIQNNTKLLSSSSAVQSTKLDNVYASGPKAVNLITGQLGYSFKHFYNEKAKDFSDSVVTPGMNTDFHLRNISPLKLEEIKKGAINHTENSIVVDLGSETVGFLDVKFNNPADQTITIAYGEHVDDNGHVSQKIGGRDFSCAIQAKAGDVTYLNPFRRLGCRYLEIKCDQLPTLDADNYIGLTPVVYPLQHKPEPTDTDLKKIYQDCVRTLECCMHEHYEDCPWREQCLYGMDSRNQMLCGYYAFEGHEYQRHNLILLAKSLRSDGMIEICSPCNKEFPIPMFSYAFVLATAEYIEHTNDTSILEEVGPAIETIYKSTQKQIDAETKLIKGFPDPYWNFYEWWKTGSDEGKPGSKDLNLNAIYVIAFDKYNQITKSSYEVDTVRSAIGTHLYDENNKVFKLGVERAETSQLVNATAICAKVKGADKNLALKLKEDMRAKWDNPDTGMTRASLSMKAFLYDALLSFDDTELTNFVLDDIKHCYNKMINTSYYSGTFWEDEEGRAAFSNAGSLCHGWSAIPVYYFKKYFS